MGVRGRPVEWDAWYSTARWARIRKHQLLVQPLCAFCLERGIVEPATICDHVEPHRGDSQQVLGSGRSSPSASCVHVHPKGLSMFCLLQLYPWEAADHDEHDCLDVIAVDGSRAVVEEFLQKYEPRYLAACLEFASWDRDKGADWTIEHERKMEELACKHHVHGALIAETEFRIVESLEVA